ncbi:MAG: hypothetical protein P1U89_12510 [Verrucomicrobiales bacterium]|nr:hypothetical protein [Verrucomicrobiales bacterium]
MSNLISGYWMRPSDVDEGTADFLWIGENGRIVHRINYKHGPFVMTLWCQPLEGDTFAVQLKPKSESHRVVITATDEALTMEHLDLKNPKCEFERIDSSQISAPFKKDLAWAEKTMDKLEKNS